MEEGEFRGWCCCCCCQCGGGGESESGGEGWREESRWPVEKRKGQMVTERTDGEREGGVEVCAEGKRGRGLEEREGKREED